MKQYYILIFLAVSSIYGCEDKHNNHIVFVENGDIFGTVTDVETGKPIEGASVNVDDKSVLTDEGGKYFLEDIPFSDDLSVVVTATGYGEHKAIISLHQELFSFNFTEMVERISL